MAAVRFATPRHDKKRKRPNKSSNHTNSNNTTNLSLTDGPGVEMGARTIAQQLEATEKWQLCTRLNMSEIRAECMKVRRELEKLGQETEAAVEKMEEGVTEVKAIKNNLHTANKATAKAIKSAMETRIEQTKNHVLAAMKQLQEQAKPSIDEDFLMTQLTMLQERYEQELNTYKKEVQRMIEEKQQEVDSWWKRLRTMLEHRTMEMRVVEERTDSCEDHCKRLESQVDSVKYDSRLALDKNVQIRMDMETMDRQIRSDMQAMNHRLGTDAESMGYRLHNVERRLEEITGGDGYASHAPHHPHSPPPMPHSYNDPFVREQLDHLRRDLQSLSDDFVQFTQQTEARHEQMHQDFVIRQKELHTELFSALAHDGRKHINENKHLRDALFYLQGDIRKFHSIISRINEPVRRSSMHRPRSRSRSRSPRRFRPLNMDPPLPYERMPQRWEEPHGNRPSFVDSTTAWHHRSRSRSPRSRAVNDNTQNNRVSDAQRSYHSFNTSAIGEDQRTTQPVALNNSTSPTYAIETASTAPVERVPPSEPDAGESTGSQSSVRRNHRPKRPHEVIVIEEEDDDDSTNEAPDRAPPDHVIEDEGPRNVEGEEASNPPSEKSSVDVDRLVKMTDVRLGSLLYVCFGGAPNLNFEWTNCFRQLRDDDCVTMARAMNFQARHQVMQAFPIYFTQFTIQSLILDAPSRSVALANGESNTDELKALDPTFVHSEFSNIVANIRMSWADTLIQQLNTLIDSIATNIPPTNQALLTVNPVVAAGINASTSVDSGIWLRAQADAMRSLLESENIIARASSLYEDTGVSPGTYLFMLMFDVVEVRYMCPQHGRYRLNSFGAKIIVRLWDHLLAKVPYLFFVDCSWLEDQADSSGKLPPLGFCHLLATILIWNSLTQVDFVLGTDIYIEAIRQLYEKLHVKNVRVRDTIESPSNISILHTDTVGTIELVNVDTKFVSLLDLNGFFEVSELLHVR